MKKFQLLVWIILFILGCSISAVAYDNTVHEVVTVKELLSSPQHWNEKTIVISGEVIGQFLHRKNGGWFHLLDHEGTAIGIWAEKEIAETFSYFGRYGVKGDRITLKGTYYSSSPLHGGDTCIYLLEILTLVPGFLLPREQIPSEQWTLIALLGLASLILFIWSIVKNRTSPS